MDDTALVPGVNEAEAETVRHIFTRYLALGSVHRLAEELAARGIVSKSRITGAGQAVGGLRFGRGALFHLLRNRLYLGQIPHKDLVHEGLHDAIVTPVLFDKVQTLLASQTRRRGEKRQRSFAEARLTGRIFDIAGNPMTPTHTKGRTGRLYRYYVSLPLQRGLPRAAAFAALAHQRVSAPALEGIVQTVLGRIMPQEAEPLRLLMRLEVQNTQLQLQIKAASRVLSGPLNPDEHMAKDPERAGTYQLTLPITLSRKGSKSVIIGGAASRHRRDPAMIAALRRAHKTVERDTDGPMLTAAPTSQYGRRLAGLALLAPDIQRAIIAGRQPHQLTLATLLVEELPIDWARQRLRFGFANAIAATA